MTSCLITGTRDDDAEAKENEEKECEGVQSFIAAHSSVILTHAFLTALERLAAGYLSRPLEVSQNQTARKQAEWYEDLFHL